MKRTLIQKLASALCLAAVTTLCAVNAPAITITTTNGSGADAELVGWGGADANPTNAVDSANGTGTSMNDRTTATRNEVICLRFDLTGYVLSNYVDFAVQLINHRANSAGATLAYYGVNDNAVALDNNGTIRGYTDDTWQESPLEFSTMPGMRWTNSSTADQIPNLDTVLLGTTSHTPVTEGSTVSFSSAALTSFIKNHPDNLVTIIVRRNDSGTGQARFATKEATVLNSGGSGNAGDYAPSLTFNLYVPPDFATWTGAAGDLKWNNSTNWNLGTPAEGTNALIGNGSNVVNYDGVMAATTFGNLTNYGTLNINTNGFASPFIFTRESAARLYVNPGGQMAVSGNLALHNGARSSLEPGSTTTIGGSLFIGSSTSGTGSGSTASGHASMTNNGGTLTASATQMNPTGGSIGTAARLIINGGTNNLGAVRIRRQPSAAEDKGLIVNDGLVTTTSITVEDNSWCSMFQAGGAVTNTGPVSVRMNGTTARPARFVQSGGLFVTTGTNIVTMYPSGGNTSIQTYYDVNVGSTNIVGGFQLGVAGTAGTVRVRNFANLYIGSMGLAWDNVASLDFQLNSGSILGATADWTNSNAPLNLLGGTIRAANLSGAPLNITMDGPLTGGAFTKTGGGTLTLNNANTYSGATTISEGTLALGVSASLNSGTDISVASGAFFDVSAPGTFFMGGSQRLQGKGSVVGNIQTTTGSQILPGGLNTAGTLTLANDLTLVGGALLTFDLSDDASGTTKTNDLLFVNNLNLFGADTITVNQLDATLPDGTYTLIKYNGSLSGDVSTLVCTSGTLTNVATAKEIRLIVSLARPPATVVWTGDGSLNYWDTGTSSNWLNAAVKDAFFTGDTAHLTDAGSTNPFVNLDGFLSPASVVVNATVDYTLAGSGSISGSTGLTKTNSGKLTIMADNAYSGVTTISGGTLSVSTLANGGANSPIGAASAASANLVLNGGALEYLGGNFTWNRGATLGASGGAVSVGSGTTLTDTGTLTGAGKLTKTGLGELQIQQSANDYAGGTEVLAGALRLDRDSGATLGTNTLTLNGGADPATFQFDGDTQTLPNLLSVVGTNNWIASSGNNTINDLTGSGTLTINGSGSTFTIQGSMATFAGTVAAGDLSNLRFHPGSVSGSSNAVFDLGTGICLLNNRNGNMTTHVGALKGGPSTSVSGASSATSATTYVIGALGLNTLFEGVITEVVSTRTNSLVKVGSGKLTLTGNSTYTGPTTIQGGTLQVDGSLGNTAVTVSGGTLAGTGTIGGPVAVNAGGNLAPGASIGTLTLSSNITLGGTLTVEVNTTAFPSADLISSSGTVNYGGTLVVSNNGPALIVSDTFQLFSAAGYSGAFASISPAQPAGGLYWDTSTLTTDGTLRISTTPTVNPNPTNIVASVTSGTLTLSWPSSHIGWTLEAQTNLLSKGLSTNWTPIGYTTTNVATFPVSPANPSVFYRLMYMVP